MAVIFAEEEDDMKRFPSSRCTMVQNCSPVAQKTGRSAGIDLSCLGEMGKSTWWYLLSLRVTCNSKGLFSAYDCEVFIEETP